MIPEPSNHLPPRFLNTFLIHMATAPTKWYTKNEPPYCNINTFMNNQSQTSSARYINMQHWRKLMAPQKPTHNLLASAKPSSAMRASLQTPLKNGMRKKQQKKRGPILKPTSQVPYLVTSTSHFFPSTIDKQYCCLYIKNAISNFSNLYLLISLLSFNNWQNHKFTKAKIIYNTLCKDVLVVSLLNTHMVSLQKSSLIKNLMQSPLLFIMIPTTKSTSLSTKVSNLISCVNQNCTSTTSEVRYSVNVFSFL